MARDRRSKGKFERPGNSADTTEQAPRPAIEALERVPRRTLHIALAAVGLALLVVFFWTHIAAHERPSAPDTTAYMGLGEPMSAWREAHDGKVPQWTPYVFSGMPSYGSMIYAAGGAFEILDRFTAAITMRNHGLRLTLFFAVAGLCLYVLMIRYGRTPLAAFLAAAVYVFTPYFVGLINAGHNSKIWAAAVLPPLLLATDVLLKERSLRALAWFALAAAWQLWCNHPQVTYYGIMLIGFIMLADVAVLGASWMERGRRLLGDSALVIGGLLLALGLMALPYLPVLDYTPESVRGSTPSAVNRQPSGGTSDQGMDRRWQFATGWSMHPKELITFVFPSFYGLWNDPTDQARVRELQARVQQLQAAGRLSQSDVDAYYEGVAHAQSYWGYMGATGSQGRFTQSTYYIGLIPLLLLAFVRPKRRGILWGTLAFSAFALVIGLGQFFPVLYWPAYKLMPYFGKFRVPSMIYMLLPLSIGIAAAWAVDELATDTAEQAARTRKRGQSPGGLKKPAIIVAVSMAILFTIALITGLTLTSNPSSILDPMQGAPQEFLDALGSVRGGMILSDVAVAAILLALFFGGLWLLHRGSLAPRTFLLVIVVAVLADLWRMDSTFIDATPPPMDVESIVKPEAVDVVRNHAESVSDTLFRVAAITGMDRAGGFGITTGLVEQNDLGQWFLSNVSGYQPAKLRIYDDLIISGAISRRPVLNMLGARYFVGPSGLNAPDLLPLGPNPERNNTGHVAYLNTEAMPRAWWVRETRRVTGDPDALGALLSPSFSPVDAAVVQGEFGRSKRYAVPAEAPTVTSFDYDRVTARAATPDTAFLIFSEVFYKDWHASIDGREVPIVQTDYVLRGIEVPPGEHEIVMEYRSPIFSTAYYGARILLVIVLLVIVVEETRRFLRQRREASE